MHRPLATLFLAVLVVLVTACASPPEFRAGSSTRTYAPYTGEVKVLDGYPAAGTYDRIGTVIVRGVRYTRDASLHDSVLDEAARRGANAIIYQGPIIESPVRDGSIERKLGAFLLRLRDG